MLRKYTLLPFLLFISLHFCLESANTAYVYNPLVAPEVWQQLEPYFLPINHPVKPRLDRIFHARRSTASKETFEFSGFKKVNVRSPLHVVIGRHDQLQGYIVKAFLDNQADVCEWNNWLRRIKGAEAIRKCIQKHDFQKYFRVPKKWIYPLPIELSPPSSLGYNRKNFILVVEDMHVLNNNDNLKAFQNKMNTDILEALYIVLTEVGLFDSIYADNIPFNKKGQINFIDTEHHNPQKPINYMKLNRYLSPQMQKSWQAIVKTGKS